MVSKKKALFAVPIALISFEIYLGVLLGYLIARFFSGKKTGEQGRIKSFVFRIGNYKVHPHHWLLSGSGVLASIVFFNFSPPFPQFFFGGLAGFIAQGIFSYSDWHKILVKAG